MPVVLDTYLSDGPTSLGRLLVMRNHCTTGPVNPPQFHTQYDIRRNADDWIVRTGFHIITWTGGDPWNVVLGQASLDAVKKALTSLGLPEDVHPDNIQIVKWEIKEDCS